MKEKKKYRVSNVLLKIIFLLGFLILMYPTVSRLYYRIEVNKELSLYKEEKKNIKDDEVEERIKLAQSYNDSINNKLIEDPYSKNNIEKGRKHYAKMLELREKIAYVQIPKIDVNIPVYAGTSEEVLQIGAGHMEGTSLPVGGLDNHAVITAHSGLPTATLFSNLNNLVVGDKFFIHNIKETLAYQVDQILVVDPTDFSKLLTVKGKDYVTLLTCTPIMINSHRLIVRGHRVEYIKGEAEIIRQDSLISNMYMYGFFASIVVILLAIILIIVYSYRKNKARKEYDKLIEELDKGVGDEE